MTEGTKIIPSHVAHTHPASRIGLHGWGPNNRREKVYGQGQSAYRSHSSLHKPLEASEILIGDAQAPIMVHRHAWLERQSGTKVCHQGRARRARGEATPNVPSQVIAWLTIPTDGGIRAVL